MGRPSLQLDTREQDLVLEMVEALGSSLNLGEVLDQAYGLMARLLPADCAAMCVSQPELPGGYDWAVARMPEAFVTHYVDLSAVDFVREAVVHQPNVVLRDAEMVAPGALERTALYQRCHDIGFPMEHVMSVLLDARSDWHGGLTLYRERQRPFSERDRALLQRLTPMLVSTVRNCRLLGQQTRRASLLDTLFHHQGAECVVLAPPGREVMRTEHATALLARWFSPLERAPGGLPLALLAPLARLPATRGLDTPPPDAWRREGPRMDLSVTYVSLPADGTGRREWAVLLRETPHGPSLPDAWRERLTPREAEVVAGVLRGWDNQLIADDLKCSLGTVKKHLQHVFDKLGVSSRAALLHQATRTR